MSRRPANVTQADVARVARVAQKLGPAWRVEIVGSLIRLVQGEEPKPEPAEPEQDEHPFARGLKGVP